MRTLITTQGRVSDVGTDQIKACFAAARESGFWLDIGAPFEEDYRLLETPTTPFAFGVGTMVVATLIQLYLFRRRGWL